MSARKSKPMKATTLPFLVEIGTEELPPKSLKKLALALLANFETLALSESLLPPGARNEVYFSPRRLALYVPALRLRQPDRDEERLGPAVSAAYDAEGKPTKAAEGFARSCGVEVSQLERRQTDKGERLAYTIHISGEPASAVLPDILTEALAKLPIGKRMRWGAGETEFVRPVHWVLMLLGDKPLKAELLGKRAGNKTYGHRFHHPAAIAIKRPADYRKQLEKTGKVLLEDQDGSLARKIGALVMAAAEQVHGKPVLDPALLEEVAALVEWPVPVTGSFDARFLSLPDAVIVAVLEGQQRYFPLRGANGKLLPHFITVSNIQSRKPVEVKRGNERVIVPRLTDAMFFWELDKGLRLDTRVAELDKVVFQKELGSYGDKRRRVNTLAEGLARNIGGDPVLAQRAGNLAKCDLLSNLVGEFPELQGSIGRYIAEANGEAAETAVAIEEQYLPRYAGDRLPETKTGQALAIADKLDTVCGIFAIGQKPTGDKDPFALRRAGLGLMRIITERELDIVLIPHVRSALMALPIQGKNQEALVKDIYEFLLERLRAYYLEAGIRADVFEAVRARNPGKPLDFQRRVQAVNAFLALPEAASLAAANKRIANILRQAGGQVSQDPRTELFQDAEEHTLHDKIQELYNTVLALIHKDDYRGALKHLAALRGPVDAFFDKVLVMAEDPAVRANRLALLSSLSALFLRIADLSLIQVD
ncbi:MAG TPA: glycine--tRNA ligase subunit beta [Gammaproteobacteria bacterium]|nr:glycine--tRNA ligase subunit beta [Gammaproteobacteria bacterium]